MLHHPLVDILVHDCVHAAVGMDCLFNPGGMCEWECIEFILAVDRVATMGLVGAVLVWRELRVVAVLLELNGRLMPCCNVCRVVLQAGRERESQESGPSVVQRFVAVYSVRWLCVHRHVHAHHRADIILCRYVVQCGIDVHQ